MSARWAPDENGRLRCTRCGELKPREARLTSSWRCTCRDPEHPTVPRTRPPRRMKPSRTLATVTDADGAARRVRVRPDRQATP